ncbi:MAG: type II secretion system protein GspD [Halanaerobiales bacterium]
MKSIKIITLLIFILVIFNITAEVAENEDEILVSTIFYETDIREALNELSLQAGVNIIFDDSISGTVTADLDKVSLEKALDLILLKGGFHYLKMGEIYLVGVADPRGSTFRHLAETETIKLKHLTSQQVKELLPSYYHKFLSTSSGKSELITINAPPSIILEFKKDLKGIDISEKEVNLQLIITEISTKYLNERGTDLFEFLNEKSDLEYEIVMGKNIALGINSGYGKFISQLKALEREDKARIRANPGLRVLNNRTAELFVGEEQVIILEPENASARLEKVDVGVAIKFTPRIIDDNLINLNIKSDLSSFTDEMEERLVVRRSDLSTNVYVKNGEIVTIAGMTIEEETDISSNIPILGDIPIFRWLFRKEAETESDRELLIFITPEIIGVE